MVTLRLWFNSKSAKCTRRCVQGLPFSAMSGVRLNFTLRVCSRLGKGEIGFTTLHQHTQPLDPSGSLTFLTAQERTSVPIP